MAQVDVGRFRSHAVGLHQDGGLLHLFIQRVAVIRIARKGSGAQDQGPFERCGNAHLHVEFVGVAALTLGYALDFWGVPAVKLGLIVFGLVVARLRDQPLVFVDALAKDFLHNLAQSTHLARDLTVQSAHDGGLAFDHFAYAPEPANMGGGPCLVNQQLALFGAGLLELDALGLGPWALRPV